MIFKLRWKLAKLLFAIGDIVDPNDYSIKPEDTEEWGWVGGRFTEPSYKFGEFYTRGAFKTSEGIDVNIGEADET